MTPCLGEFGRSNTAGSTGIEEWATRYPGLFTLWRSLWKNATGLVDKLTRVGLDFRAFGRRVPEIY